MSRTMRLILLALKPSESRLLRTKKVWKSQQKKGGAKDCVCCDNSHPFEGSIGYRDIHHIPTY